MSRALELADDWERGGQWSPKDMTEAAALLRSLHQDAERWRQIRKPPINGGKRDWLYMPHTEELDAWADAAMKGEQ